MVKNGGETKVEYLCRDGLVVRKGLCIPGDGRICCLLCSSSENKSECKN